MKRFGLFVGLLLLGVVWFLAAQPVQAQPPLLPEGPAACTAQETSYQSALSAVGDSYVNDLSVDTNYGTATTLRVGPYVAVPTNGNYRSFVAFDLSSLPADAVILTATLELYQTNSGSISVAAQAVTGDWDEATVTWNTQPTYTTVDESVGTLVDGWYRWDITPIVQNWRSGALTNYGLRLAQYGIATTNPRYFSSREGANPPRLVVEYVLRKTLTVLADTSIVQTNPTGNNGDASDISVLRDASFNESHVLLQFDVSGVPVGSTIISATLNMHATVNRVLASPQAGIAVSPTANLGSWTEMGVTWNNRPAAVSQGDPSSTFVDGGYTYWDVTNIVQAWSSSALINYGFSLKPAVGETGSASFMASEGGYDPQLIITYGPPPCYSATSVTIGGATQGITDTQYTFNATIAPANATPPITYTWEATEQIPHTGPQEDVEYAWSTPGWKTITVTVENCESSVMDTHLVSITVPAPACAVPLTGLSLAGPTQGITDTSYTFTADASPDNATKPVTYTWEADEQTPSVGGQVIKSYTWITPGTKHITVTVSNCGGAFVQYRTIDIIPRGQLPDLQITSIWYNLDESRVYYIVKNAGGSAAPAGFTVSLTRAVTEVAQSTFPEVLQPGWVRAGFIDYAWGCADLPPGTSALRALVTADSGDTVLEGDEGNNSFEDWWLCDLYPPEIIAGPTFTGLTEHTASITWTTDKPVRSYFDYGKNGPFNITTIADMTYKTDHQVSLTGLDHASVYWYRIRITDEQGLLNTTAGDYFETMPPGTDPATLGVIGLSEYPSTTYEFYTLYADVTSDVTGVDRVSFFLDGQLIGRDFTPTGTRYEVYVSPAALGLARAEWFTFHDLQVQAYNLENEVTAKVGSVKPTNRPMPGEANLVSPSSGKQIYIDGTVAPAGTSLNVLVYGEQYMWECTETAYTEGVVPPGMNGVACSNVMQNLKTMRLYLDGAQVGTYTPGVGAYNHWFDVNLTGKSVGDHTLRFEAETTDGSIFADESTIKLVQGRGEIDLGHTATRNGNTIQVTLFISNTGTGTAYVDYVEDFARGFQVIETSNALGLMSPTANYYHVKNGDYGDTPNRKIMVDLSSDADDDEIVLSPGASYAVTYKLVPVLYPEWDYYYIGSGHGAEQAAWVRYRLEGVGGYILQEFREGDNWVDGEWIDDVVHNIVAGSDYILVTSPAGLVAYTEAVTWRSSLGTQRELSLLLSKIAELATYRNGVLGYLPINPCAAALDALLVPGGYWSNALHPNFQIAKSGYVLFVGEDEVIPVQGAGYGVPYSDLRYASTADPANPELVLGRIVGNDMGTLRRGIENSLYVARTGNGFDRQRALLNSGRGPGESYFWEQVKEVRNRLNFPTIAALRWKDIGTTPDILARIQTEMALGQSLVVYRGHGASNAWGYDSSAQFTVYDIASLNFNNYHPFVWGLGCSTGDFRNSYSNPEGWLRYGAGAYVGAVSTAYTDRNGDATRAFFNRWGDDGSLSAGYAKVDMERDHWGDSSDWKAWIYQHPLLGDPKFGALPTLSVNAAQPVAPDGPIGAVTFTLPDYEVMTDEDGLDHVTLPDGSSWLSPTEYIVPTWKAIYTYPQGQRVQDVVLTLQSGLMVTTSLHLPTHTLAIDCDCIAPTVAPLQATASITGWYPKFEQDSAWNIFENPDGSSTLEVLIYPFTYNPETTDVRFYQEWNFDIDVFTTTVNILDLKPTQATYYLTETVGATLVVNNSGAEQPVIVQPVIKSLSDEVQTALPLQALHAITGTSLLDLVITDTLAAGDYVLDVTLVDMEGHVLDTAATEFAVGVAAGEVTNLTAAPTTFQAGDNIDITMTFQNTGDVTLNGVAVIRVQTSDGVTQTAEFTHTLSSLTSGATATFDDVWDSTGAISETYRVLGYVTYNLGVSTPKEVMLSLSTHTYIYLPLVLRSSN
jgi:hypothetical protein